jgi:RimJ/RimL family protein N-acetyltransferase
MELLKGKKVYLKLFEEEDIPDRLRWINDPDSQNTLNYDIPTSVSKTKRWFSNMVMDPSRREFSIYTVDGNKRIGFCGLLHIEVPAMKAELHCVLGEKAYWRGGYGTETYKLLIDYGFTELGLNRIYGYQLLNNYGAHRVVEKLGWIREGLLRKDCYSHGVLKDVYMVSIIREDWLKLNSEQDGK